MLVHLIISGTQAEADQYVGFGRAELRKLEKQEHNISRKFRFPNADLVMVKKVGGHGYIHITIACSGRMETGALVVGPNMARNLENISSSELFDEADPTSGSLGSMRIIREDTELYRYDPEEDDENVPSREQAEKACTSDLDDSIDQECVECQLLPVACKLSMRKKIAFSLNPSQFTGKMRLFMQAMLGSQPDRFKLYGNYALRDTGFTLDSESMMIQRGTILIRDEHFNYWFVSMSGFSEDENRIASMAPLKFSGCGVGLLEKIKAGVSPDEERQLEAALFTFTEEYPILPPPEGFSGHGTYWVLPESEALWPPGAPLNGGWHAAYSKAEAIRVNAKSGAEDGLNTWNTSRYWKAKFQTQHYDKATEDPIPPSVSFKLVETGQWQLPKLVDWVFHYDPFFGVEIGFSGIYPIYGYPHKGDAPVYAFYDADDEPIVVRYARDPAEIPPDIDQNYNEVDFCGLFGSVTYESRTHTPNGGVHGFYIKGHTDTRGEGEVGYVGITETTTGTPIAEVDYSYFLVSGTNTIPVGNPVCGDSFVGDLHFTGPVQVTDIRTSQEINYTADIRSSGQSGTRSFLAFGNIAPDVVWVGGLQGDSDFGSHAVNGNCYPAATRKVSGGGAFGASTYVPNTAGCTVIENHTVKRAEVEWSVYMCSPVVSELVGSGAAKQSIAYEWDDNNPPVWNDMIDELGADFGPWFYFFITKYTQGITTSKLEASISAGGLMTYYPNGMSDRVCTYGADKAHADVFLGWA